MRHIDPKPKISKILYSKWNDAYRLIFQLEFLGFYVNVSTPELYNSFYNSISAYGFHIELTPRLADPSLL